MKLRLVVLSVLVVVSGCRRHAVVDAGVETAPPEHGAENGAPADAGPTVTVSAGAAVVLPSAKTAAMEPAADASVVDSGEPDAGAEEPSVDAGPAAIWTTLDGGERDDAGVSDFVRLRVGGRLAVKFEGPIVGMNCDDRFVEPVVNGMNVELVGAKPGLTHCVFKIFSPNLPGRYFEITVVP